MPISKTKTKSQNAINFAELLVVLNGCVPLVLMSYDAKYHRLGPNPIHNALHTSGTLAVFLLLASLSITPLRVILKQPKLILLRRPLGLVAFLYACTHVMIYVAYDRDWQWQVAWNEIVSRRYLQVGAFALLLLIPLAVTSTPTMMKLIGFRSWKRLHRLVYVATIAAVVHYYLQSKADVRWPIIFGFATFAMLLFRVMFATAKRRKIKAKVE